MMVERGDDIIAFASLFACIIYNIGSLLLLSMMVERGVNCICVASTIDREIHCDVMGKIVLIPMHVAGSSSRRIDGWGTVGMG